MMNNSLDDETDGTFDKFVDELGEASRQVWLATQSLSVVKHLLSGKLDSQRFVYFLVQDYLYLDDYGRALAIAAIKSKDPEVRSALMHFATSALEDEKQFLLQESRAAQCERELTQNARKMPSTQAYGDFLVRTASQETFGEIIAAFLVCNWSFYEIGKSSLHHANADVESGGTRWRVRYASTEVQSAVRWYKSLLADICRQSTDVERSKIRRAFEIASHYEYQFWKAVDEMQDWPCLAAKR